MVSLRPVLVLVGLLLIGGCAAVDRADVTAADQPPPDFSLDVTILSAVPVADDTSTPPHLRQSRYVIFPDGRLHYGADADRGAAWLPPAVRTLDSTLMRELWTLALDTSIADSAQGQPPTNFKTIEPSAGQALHVLAITGHGQRWAVIRHADASQADAATARMIHHLAELSFAADDEQLQRPLPQRYDFGPDPYERYR